MSYEITMAEVALSKFKKIIDEFEMDYSILDDRNIILVKKYLYAITISISPYYGEINIYYHTAHSGNLWSIDVVSFIWKSRRKMIVVESLVQADRNGPSGIYQENTLYNSSELLLMAGRDILGGDKKWIDLHDLEPEDISPSEAAMVLSLIRDPGIIHR